MPLWLVLFLAACSSAPAATSTPTLLPSLTPSVTPDVQAAVEATLTVLAPTTVAMQLTAESTAEDTPEATPVVVEVDPVLGQAVDPPLDITLPEGWALQANDTLVLSDLSSTEELRGIPFVAWNGPVTGGTGTIVLLWGFPSLVPLDDTNAAAAMIGTPPPADLFADGLRLLRLAVIDPSCNIGTDLRRTYRIGTLSAVGTQFAAVECPDLPDTRGWFAGVQANNLSFIFYVYTDPIEAMDTGRDGLQGILDTVQFRVP
ncbi:MAG: hypothetical protein K8L97_08875 [Anaerolineae bacterium]|nr:hypothetical protein [Anaerolineae bacterium]